MRSIACIGVLVISCLLLAGCGGDHHGGSDGGNGPVSLFNPFKTEDFLDGVAYLPFPNNALFRGSHDGTVDAPVSPSDPSDPTRFLNQLDGFSTSASADVDFSKSLAPVQDFSGAVLVYRLDPTGHIVRQLQFGSAGVPGSGQYEVSGDYTVHLEVDDDNSNKRLVVQPLKPLRPETRYLVVVTRKAVGLNGEHVRPSRYFKAVRSATPVAKNERLSGLTAKEKQTLAWFQQHYKPLFGALSKQGVSRSDIANAWTFSTQSIGKSLEALRKKINGKAAPGRIALADTGKTTAAFGGNGAAEVFVGTVTLPYHLGVPTQQDPDAILHDIWRIDPSQTPTTGMTAMGEPCTKIEAPKSTTNCYPKPRATARVTIPVLASVPLDGNGQVKQGASLAIYEHGIFANRKTLVLLADSFAAKGLATIAIDQPLHGLSPGDSFYYGPLVNGKTGDYTKLYKATTQYTAPRVGGQTAWECEPVNTIYHFHCFGERTFNYMGGDGKVDSSGLHFMNIASLLTTRDNIREAVTSLVSLHATLKTADSIPLFNGQGKVGSLAVDNSQIVFLGHSLGAIVGTIYTAVAADSSFPSVLAMPGGGLLRMLIGSPSFSKLIKTVFIKPTYHLEQGSRAFQQLLRYGQTAIDAGDPVNYAPALAQDYSGPLPASRHPIQLIEVIGDGKDNKPDQTVPNNVLEAPYIGKDTALQPAPLAGTDPLISLIGLDRIQVTPPVQESHTVSGSVATQFTEGGHTSILIPPGSDVTVEMQCEAAAFLASGGTTVPIGCGAAH